jgi:triosephosphate isomerase
MLQLPVIVVNCKAYERAVGEGAVRIAEICERVAARVKVSVVVAVEPADIYHVKMAVRIPVFAQHVDAVEPGAHTGVILPEAVRDAGAAGTLLNHSERRLAQAVLAQSITRARKAGLITLACASTPDEAARIAALQPDLIAIEPPELIGGTVSVSKAKPEVITLTTHAITGIPVLCGAGIKTAEDIRKAMQLGAKGILASSGVTLAKNPEQVLLDFATAMQTFK